MRLIKMLNKVTLPIYISVIWNILFNENVSFMLTCSKFITAILNKYFKCLENLISNNLNIERHKLLFFKKKRFRPSVIFMSVWEALP